MNVLEDMLHVETEARKIVENAQNDANAIRKKAREDAKRFISEGKQAARDHLKQEVSQLEQDADVQRTRILTEAQERREALEQKAAGHIDKAVEKVMDVLLHTRSGNGNS